MNTIQWQRFFTVEKMERIKNVILSKRFITETGCWTWTGIIRRDGYAIFRDGHDVWYAHRLAAMIWLNHNPDSIKFICHKCDNKKCINPDHFFIGSPKENSEDMVNKGRQAKGERQGASKLTISDVKEIIDLVDNESMSRKEIADIYGITQANISIIVTGQGWVAALEE